MQYQCVIALYKLDLRSSKSGHEHINNVEYPCMLVSFSCGIEPSNEIEHIRRMSLYFDADQYSRGLYAEMCRK